MGWMPRQEANENASTHAQFLTRAHQSVCRRGQVIRTCLHGRRSLPYRGGQPPTFHKTRIQNSKEDSK